ncbi:nurim [Erpetoichthys calabaricus]|uniref:nurim n=1 Tax=Erpetoichthys calabaricus TaxID=27687 RepID=UPI0010A0A928|nr:nurim [Erpetoichthys calabaricus]
MAPTGIGGVCLAFIALCNFVFVFGTGVEFVRFISFRAIYHNNHGVAPQSKEESSREWGESLRDPKVFGPLTQDFFLLLLFVVQHSLLASASVKRWCQAIFGVLQRAFYVFTTSLALQVVIRYWQPVQNAPLLWNASTAPWDTWVPLLCFILHFICWLIIFSIVLIFDYPELMGIKQVYYHCLGLEDPLSLKSPRAQRLYAHLRHPVYLELCVVLWIVPSLSLDRVLLATMLTLYLSCGHSLDNLDYAYLRAQLHNKLDLFTRQEMGGEVSELNGAQTDESRSTFHKAD